MGLVNQIKQAMKRDTQLICNIYRRHDPSIGDMTHRYET